MTAQLSLIPQTVVDGVHHDIPLTELPDFFYGRVVDPKMTESIATFGVLQPILCKYAPDGGFMVCDGRSRIVNSRAAGRTTIPAHVFPADYTTHQILSIVANAKRSENFVTDVLAIQEIMEIDKEVSLTDICNATGLSPATAKQRMKLLNLIPDLMNLLKANQLAQNLADKIAGLNELQQAALYRVFLDTGKITAADIKQITSAGASQAAMELDEDLFDDKDGAALELCRDILAACRTNQARLPMALHNRLMDLVGGDPSAPPHDFEEEDASED